MLVCTRPLGYFYLVPAVHAYGLVYTAVASLCSVFVPSLTPPGFMHVTYGLWPAGPAATQRLADACTYLSFRYGLQLSLAQFLSVGQPAIPSLR